MVALHGPQTVPDPVLTRPRPLARVVIITGGSSGIGRCCAARFARDGWRVGLIARNPAGLAATAADVEAAGSQAAVAVADVTDTAALGRAAQAIVAALGPPDVWVNCAGNGVYGRFGTVPEAEYDRVTAVTYGGTVNGCRVALALMRPRGEGTIVNVCSAMAFHGLPLMTSYAGAKAAVRGFGQALRAELRVERSRIRVATVFPPAVNTPFFSHATSHMGRPARPAPPVYQPEVAAAGIYFAAVHAPRELVLSGTVVVFDLVNRLFPRLIAYAVTRLGFERQLTSDRGALALERPTMFTPADTASPVHGPFGARARRRSWHVWLIERLHPRAPTARAALTRRPPAPPSPAKPVPPKPV